MNADVLKPRLSRTGGRIDPGADYPEDLKARLAASYNTRNYDPYLSSTGTPPVINGFRKSPLHRRDTLIPNGNDVVIDVDELMRHVKHKGTHKRKVIRMTDIVVGAIHQVLLHTPHLLEVLMFSKVTWKMKMKMNITQGRHQGDLPIIHL